MKLKALKYGMVLIIPALFVAGVFQGGWATYGALLFAFGVIPLIEVIFRPDERNVDEAERLMRLEDRTYDYLLYLVVPVVYICVYLYLSNLNSSAWSTIEFIGLTLSLGVVLGGLGINVAHELGHRSKPTEQFLAKMLLLASGYMHFYIEHNRGHHKYVSTMEDPASARFGESLYHFWIRSVIYSYVSAWKLETERLRRKKTKVVSFENEMLRFQLVTLAYWMLIGWFFGWIAILLYTGAAVAGFLLLETVNYIEHYGLQRRKLNPMRYENVTPVHSWNSNHVIGRIMLFELSRHSDHHYQPGLKYQVLSHHDQSPQMPTGYPGMMLLSLIPPLWFKVMNHRVRNYIPENRVSAQAA